MHDNGITINDFVSRYIDEIKPLLRSAGTLSPVLVTFAESLPDMPLVHLRGHHVHDYTQRRIGAGIKISTVNRELSVISAAVNHAVRRWGVQVENPVRYQWLKSQPLRLRYLDKIEAQRLIVACQELSSHLCGFVTLALHTGCRKNELLTARWSDVDLLRRYLVLRPENTKTAKRRAVPLNQTAIKALTALKAAVPAGAEWVFSKNDGGRVKALDYLFRKALKNAGITDFKIHDLRHTFASWLVSEGVELVKVRDLLGHASIKMTERYAHLMPNKLQDAVSVLDSFASS